MDSPSKVTAQLSPINRPMYKPSGQTSKAVSGFVSPEDSEVAKEPSESLEVPGEKNPDLMEVMKMRRFQSPPIESTFSELG